MDGMMRALGLLWLAVTIGGATVAETMHVVVRYTGRTPAQTYLAGLRNLALVVILAPIFLVYAGVVRDNDWLVIAACAIWVIASVMIWVLGSYIAVLIDALRQLAGKVKEGDQRVDIKGKAYIENLVGVIVTEIFIAFAGVILPWNGNVKLAVMGALAAAGLGMVYYLEGPPHRIWRKTMEWSFLGFLVIGLIYLLATAYFPNRSAQVAGMVKNLDNVNDGPRDFPKPYKIVSIMLRGEDQDSVRFDVMHEVKQYHYACWTWPNGMDPRLIRARMYDVRGNFTAERFIDEDFGKTSASFAFRGPSGTEVVIRVQSVPCNSV